MTRCPGCHALVAHDARARNGTVRLLPHALPVVNDPRAQDGPGRKCRFSGVYVRASPPADTFGRREVK